jgi:DNA-binding MarR family transcriptional regulator
MESFFLEVAMADNEDPTGERTFLHDLSNIIAITQGNLQLLMRKIKKNPDEVKIEDISSKLEVTSNSVTRMIDLLNLRRETFKAKTPGE